MLVGLDQFLTTWLGPATALGATSWLQAFTWVATVFAAIFAGVALRRNALQNRAALLLNLHKYYDDLAMQRRAFHEFNEETMRYVKEKYKDLQESHQEQRARTEFIERLTLMRDKDNLVS